MLVVDTNIQECNLFKKGKVRDIYDLGNSLLIIATDSIFVFFLVLPTPVPDKGKILTRLSRFWFEYVRDIISNHIISCKVESLPQALHKYKEIFEDRFMLVKKTEVVPFECVVRGYLAGSGWKEYQERQSICGVKIMPGLKVSSKLPEPIFTPATKAEQGHDENVTFEYMQNKIGKELAERIKRVSLSVYTKASRYAEKKGFIIADTKFEFGISNGSLLLIDELLTSDSSRFWLKAGYQEGVPQPAFDKQFVRDYLETLDWDKTYPGPELPEEIVERTREKYLKISEIILGE